MKKKFFKAKRIPTFFASKYRIIIKNASTSPMETGLKAQSQKSNCMRNFAGGKNAPTRIKSYRGKYSAIF